MITREQIEAALGDDNKHPFKTKNIDYHLVAIALLRDRIPYEACKSIIVGAGYDDVLYLCDVDKVLPFLTEQDLEVLSDCNMWIDDDTDSLALFV